MGDVYPCCDGCCLLMMTALMWIEISDGWAWHVIYFGYVIILH